MTAQEFYDSLMGEHSKPAESGRISANLQRKVLEAKLRVTIYILYTMRTPHLQEETGKLLLCGEGADEYYDLFSSVMEFVNKAGSSFSLFTGLIDSFNRFCSKVPEQVYCKVMREFSLKHYEQGRFSFFLGKYAASFDNRVVSKRNAVHRLGGLSSFSFFCSRCHFARVICFGDGEKSGKQ